MPFDRTCPGCEKPFTTRFRPQRFCSKKCAGSSRGSVRSCQGCGHEFRAYREDSLFCSENCRRKANKPKRRTCAAKGCKKRFYYTKTPKMIYCSKNCGARARYTMKPLKCCQHCGIVVKRRSKHGVAPSVCDDCKALHHAILSLNWRKKNPEKWELIKERYEAKGAAMREKIRQFEESVFGRFMAFERASQELNVSKGFWLDLHEIIHYTTNNVNIRKGRADISFNEWKRVKYAGKEASFETMDRSWSRYKKKAMRLRLADRKVVQKEGLDRVALDFDIELSRMVLKLVFKDD